MTHLTSGSLLIASPDIDDDLFRRSVLLLCEHSQVGSFGLIINKPLQGALPSELSELDQSQIATRAGGPIQPDQMMLLHTYPDTTNETLCVTEGIYLGGDGDTMQKALESGDPFLLMFGYMGWGQGQLEQEFLAGLWYLHPASRAHVFDAPTETLWKNTLREMGGKYATLSMMPDDLSLN